MASLAPETIFQIGQIPITNTVISTLLVDAAIIGGVIALNKNIKKVPGYFQNIFEMILDGFYSFIESIAGKNVEKIYPYVISFFLFILISNWSGLLPGVGSIGFTVKEEPTITSDYKQETTEHETVTTKPLEKADGHEAEKSHEFIPLFRNATSDVNVTFALAIISLVATHTLGIRATGFRDYLSRFISLNPILLFVGFLELVSEVTKIISLSFRLFGNIFAGEVVLHTVSSLFAFVFPIPFMTLELIVGLVQALVFSILTMVFMSIMMTPHHAEKH